MLEINTNEVKTNDDNNSNSNNDFEEKMPVDSDNDKYNKYSKYDKYSELNRDYYYHNRRYEKKILFKVASETYKFRQLSKSKLFKQFCQKFLKMENCEIFSRL